MMHHLPLVALAALAVAQHCTAQLRVALVAAESSSTACAFTDPQTRLLATNLFSVVDIVNTTAAGGGTPTLAQLLTYDAVMVWTNSTPASSVALGDVLADYVDAGGGVVVTVYANSTTTANRNLGGRWQTGYEVILDQSGNSSGANGTLGTVHLPQHPVMAGVTSFTAGTIGSRPNGTALEVGATLVAEWSNGKVLVAQGANPKRIDLGFFPVNTSCSTVGYTTGGDLLMANALVAASAGATFVPFGAGCAGTLGVPGLTAATGSRPILGGNYTLTVGNLPIGVGFLVTGFSNTASGPFALPLDLTPFGMAGCSLLVDALTNTVVAGPATSATWSITLPASPAFSGLELFHQAFAIDPPANVPGLTASNGGKSRLGT
jgi:hypothetical protein